MPPEEFRFFGCCSSGNTVTISGKEHIQRSMEHTQREGVYRQVPIQMGLHLFPEGCMRWHRGAHGIDPQITESVDMGAADTGAPPITANKLIFNC